MSKAIGNITSHQLNILADLLDRQSVTQTAARFNTSQSSVSRLLADMRHRFNDPLLVRSGDKMIVTDRGMVAKEQLEEILQRLSNLVDPENDFDPSTSDQLFSVGFADSNIASLGPAVVAEILKGGPNLRTRLSPIASSDEVVGGLEKREFDVVVDCVTRLNRDLHEHLKFYPLAPQDVVLLTRRGHPIEVDPPITDTDYHKWKHVAPSPMVAPPNDPIGETLRRLSQPRKVYASVPDYNLIPYVLMETDLVFTTSREFAARFAQILPLSITPAPDFFPKLEFRLLWHAISDQNPSCIWLRKKIMLASKIRRNLDLD